MTVCALKTSALWCWQSKGIGNTGVGNQKVMLEISQNSLENNRTRVSFFMKLQALGLEHY